MDKEKNMYIGKEREMKKKTGKERNRSFLAVLLSIVLAWELCLIGVVGAAYAATADGRIDEVEELPPEILEQTVAYGTERSELELPDTLSVFVNGIDEDEEETMWLPYASASDATPSNASASDAEDASVEGAWVEAPVLWTVNRKMSTAAEYDGELPGIYVFDVEFVNGRYRAGDALLPSIEVEVLPETEELPEDRLVWKAVVGGITITLTADAGVFPEGARLEAEAVDGQAEAEQIAENVRAAADTGSHETLETLIFDVRMLDEDGEEQQPDLSAGTPEITFSFAQEKEDRVLQVFHMEDAGAEAEAVSEQEKGSSVTAQAEHFSYYVLAVTSTEAASEVARIESTGAEYGTVAEAIADAGVGDTVVLLADVEESISIESGEEVILDLNGYTLMGLDSKSAILLYGTLTLKDNSNGSGAVVSKDGYNVISVSNGTFVIEGGTISGEGYGIRTEESSVMMKGGTISGTKFGIEVDDNSVFIMEGGEISDNPGVGVDVHGGTFTMNGGAISNNMDNGVEVGSSEDAVFIMNGGEISNNVTEDTGGGGGVIIIMSGKFIMNSGKITGNQATVDGGGVCMNGSESVFIMTGGEISGNTAGRYGGGVFAYGQTMEISGTAVIQGNENENGDTDNVFIYPNHFITLAGDLEDGASIGVNVYSTAAPTEGSPTAITSAEDGTDYYLSAVNYVTSDDESYEVKANSTDGCLELCVKEYTEPLDITLSTLNQEYEYDGTAKTFSTTNNRNVTGGFTVTYLVDGVWTTDAPSGVGTYEVQVTRDETAGYNALDVTGTLTILPGELSGVTTTGYSGVYDGEGHTITVTLSGDAEGATVTYSDVEDGTYTEEAISYSGTGSHTVYYRVEKENYDAVSGSAQVEISVLMLEKPQADDTVYTYNGSAQTYGLETSGFYTITGGTQTDAGTYEVTVSLDNQADTAWADGTTDDLSYAFVIGEAELTGVTVTDYSGVYDGEEHTVTVALSGDAEGAEVTYAAEQDGSYTAESVAYRAAGSYTVYYRVAKENYLTVDGSAAVEITRLSAPVPDAGTEVFTYNGEAQTYDLEESSYYTVANATQTNAGIYEVTVSLTDKASSMWADGTTDDLTYEFIIHRAEYDMGGVTFADAAYVYDGTEKSLSVSGELPDGVTVSYADHALTNVGSVTATAKFTGDTDNYEAIPDMEAVLTITVREIPAPGAGETVLAYNGEAQAYYPEESSESIFYSVSGNVQTEIGAYEAVVSLNDPTNTVWEGGSTENLAYPFVVGKGTYDMGNVSFTDATYVYDGTERSLTVTGELPDGVTVSYTNNTLTNIGSVTATASFSGDWEHYEAIADRTAVLTVEKAALSGVEVSGYSGTYDGAAHSITVQLSGDAEEANVSYSIDGETYTEENPSFTGEGSYTVYYRVNTGDGNYYDVTGSAVVSITPEEEEDRDQTGGNETDSGETGETGTDGSGGNDNSGSATDETGTGESSTGESSTSGNNTGSTGNSSTENYPDSGDDDSDDSSSGSGTTGGASPSAGQGGVWEQSGGSWKYVGTDGIPVRGSMTAGADGETMEQVMWSQIDGSWWAFGADGNEKDGWVYDYSVAQWYYVDINSGMKYGWHQDGQDGHWYYLDPQNGQMLTGWQYIDGRWYYFNAGSIVQTWSYDSLGGSWIYDPSSVGKPFGALYAGEQTPDGYLVDVNGAMV